MQDTTPPPDPIRAAKRQFSLAGMLGYTTVLAVILAFRCMVGGRRSSPNPCIGLVFFVALSGWLGYGFWVLFGRRGAVLSIVIGVLTLVFLPMVLSIAEHMLLGSHHVEECFRDVGLHDVYDNVYDGIWKALGLD
jgi:hypothetical protein